MRLVFPKHFAGIAIAIGTIAYLSVDNKIVGSALFSIGLISVLLLKWNLYTGKIGYAKKSDALLMATVFLGNIIGSSFAMYGDTDRAR